MQICGHCAREQPFAKAPCVSCGEALGKGQGPLPRFWEGGAGQRDKRLMSNRDPRKFKNSAMKTKSKKAERVGLGAVQAKKKKAAAAAAEKE